MGGLALRGKPTEGWGAFERIVTETVAPLQSAFRSVSNGISGVVDNYIYLLNVRKENENLKRRLESLTFELNNAREKAEATDRLKKLLNFAASITEPMVPAQVVGQDPSGWFKTLIIDKGEKDGVKKDMAVINPEGVVGRVIAVSPHYAKVLLIIDANSSVDALTQDMRYRGILTGGSDDNPCELKYVSPLYEIKKGERVVTSGLSHIFPKGMLLGVVESVESAPGTMFQKILVRPAVDLSRLEEVLVVVGREEDKEELP